MESVPEAQPPARHRGKLVSALLVLTGVALAAAPLGYLLLEVSAEKSDLEKELASTEDDLDRTQDQLTDAEQALADTEQTLSDTESELADVRADLRDATQGVGVRDDALAVCQQVAVLMEDALNERNREAAALLDAVDAGIVLDNRGLSSALDDAQFFRAEADRLYDEAVTLYSSCFVD
jgi:septal ring factor EnvC (AmiA/AmiB activator)